MNNYLNYLKDLDDFLSLIKNNHEYAPPPSFKWNDKEYLNKLCNRLQDDGLIKQVIDSAGRDVLITSLGYAHISNGGYLKEYKNQIRKEKRERKLISSTIKLNTTSIKYFRLNFTFTIINLILLLMSFIK